MPKSTSYTSLVPASSKALEVTEGGSLVPASRKLPFLGSVLDGMRAFYSTSGKVAKTALSTTALWLSPFQYMGRVQFSNWSTERAIRDGYKSSHWVFRCVKTLADAAGCVPWIVQKRDKKTGEWIRVPGHPLELLLENPNSQLTRHDMIFRITAQLNLCGNALLHKVRASKGIVAELETVNPDRVQPIPDPNGYITEYAFRVDGQDQDPIPASDIIHLMFPDPGNPYWGCGPLQAAGRLVDTEVEAVKWWKVSLQNRCVKDGVLSYKRPLTKRQWTEARKQLGEQSGSSVGRNTLVLGDDVTFTPFSMTPAELDFINSRKMTRDDIVSVFGVPPPLVGILDHGTYANIKEARNIFWLETILPYLEAVRQVFTLALVPDFGSNLDLRVYYDLTNVEALIAVLDEKALAAEKYFRMGVPFEHLNKRMMLGFPNNAADGISFVPGNMMPYGEDPVAMANNPWLRKPVAPGQEPAKDPEATAPKAGSDKPTDEKKPSEDAANSKSMRLIKALAEADYFHRNGTATDPIPIS